MRFEFSLQPAPLRLIVGFVLLAVFTIITQHAENTYFADRASNIPLFGTELAIQNEPSDPLYESQLGNYWMIAAQQPSAAMPHFLRATQLDPRDGRYWGQLALAFQQIGDSNLADGAVAKALAADPTTPELLWQAANIYSFMGENEKAIAAIHRFVSASPEQTPIAAQLGWRATRDATLLLDRVLPRNVDSELSLLIVLVRTQDPDASARIRFLDTDPNDFFVHNLATLASPQPIDTSGRSAPPIDLAVQRAKARSEMLRLLSIKTGDDWAKTENQLQAEESARAAEAYRRNQTEKAEKFADAKDTFDAAATAWNRLMHDPSSFDIRLALPYIQMLIDADQASIAQNAWASLVDRESRLKNWSTSNNLIKNASFEHEVLNGGFDWQYVPSDAIDLAVDHHTSKDGSSSLLMRFKNKPVAEAGILQYVPVKPGVTYEFTGYLKSEAVEGATGVRFEVQDVDAANAYLQSDDVKGTTAWIKVSGRFTTAPSAHFVTIKIVRNPGNTLINGRAWADALSLVEKDAK